MERMERDFKGVWIPREIWLSEELSLMEKVLFVEIHSLDKERGCFASNQYFADFFGMSARQIFTHIGSLKEKGYIHITITIVNQNERTIRSSGKYAHPNPQQMRHLKKQAAELTAELSTRWRVDNRRGGMKKASWGV